MRFSFNKIPEFLEVSLFSLGFEVGTVIMVLLKSSYGGSLLKVKPIQENVEPEDEETRVPLTSHEPSDPACQERLYPWNFNL